MNEENLTTLTKANSELVNANTNLTETVEKISEELQEYKNIIDQLKNINLDLNIVWYEAGDNFKVRLLGEYQNKIRDIINPVITNINIIKPADSIYLFKNFIGTIDKNVNLIPDGITNLTEYFKYSDINGIESIVIDTDKINSISYCFEVSTFNDLKRMDIKLTNNNIIATNALRAMKAGNLEYINFCLPYVKNLSTVFSGLTFGNNENRVDFNLCINGLSGDNNTMMTGANDTYIKKLRFYYDNDYPIVNTSTTIKLETPYWDVSVVQDFLDNLPDLAGNKESSTLNLYKRRMENYTEDSIDFNTATNNGWTIVIN